VTVQQFSQPVRQVVSMVIVLILVGAGAWIAFPSVAPVFLANKWLNGAIAFVFVLGVLTTFWQVFQLMTSVSWIEGFAADRPGHEMTHAPRLLAPLAALLRSRGKRMQISASSSRSILDSVATRIDEERDITRYLTNLLIFLGLLGTFWGLATTVPAFVETIRNLAPREGEPGVAVFERLMAGLESQLGGMGTAFSSSLLGLAGSLVVGLLELFASHGQNRFYRELEEWLSGITRLGFASEGEGAADTSAVMGALEQMTEYMAGVRDVLESTEASRSMVDDRIDKLAGFVERLAARIEGEGETQAALARMADARVEGESQTQAMLSRIADTQARIAELLENQGRQEGGVAGADVESRMRLRSMDIQLLRILEEMSAGRQESIADLRSDLAQLTRAVRQIGKDTTPLPARRSS
jgi:hypothetical protein